MLIRRLFVGVVAGAFWVSNVWSNDLTQSVNLTSVAHVYGAVKQHGIVEWGAEHAPTLEQAIAGVGGLRDDAFLWGAILLRSQAMPSQAGAAQSLQCLPWRLQQALGVLAQMSADDLPGFSLEALTAQMQAGQWQRVFVNPLILGGSASDAAGSMVMQAGDVLVIPRRSIGVTQVTAKNTYQLPYRPGWLAHDYRRAARIGAPWWGGVDRLILPDGQAHLLNARFWNDHPTAVPPGALLVWKVGAQTGCSAQQRSQ